ncbi:Hydroxyneurosporene synthase (CrtC) [Candidatus Methylomirabilis lanthanidiphila]|uniref:Hydroxyneurosporene synthase (CrtC) n=1 Tax=Candidatus Methylomirabilis lanthanidiphila TaxID=2211376 RepID=A0A564ZKC1_9BACT|nr:carotenoid 1,2-hydratase [Candidatus Methylomirabilis lanthanidiphila]VUZ85307.1 Hydroxyneurosporene synthase (CrtC) [Candidatus Methylomirabilis lanthanidiphila]
MRRFSDHTAKPVIIGIAMLLCLSVGSGAYAKQAFRQALPGYRFAFPRDHASHPDFKTEWWYYSGHLQTEDGQRFGYQLTFFRVGVDPSLRGDSRSRWAVRDLHLAHFAISDLTQRRFQFWERRSRGALDSAGALTAGFKVWNGPWEASGDEKVHHVTARAEGYAIDLTLTPTKPPAIHGSHGVSQKAAGPGRASHYYSLTNMATEGTLTLTGKPRTVTGSTWMDHEFGSNQLTESQVGWDWFAIQLEDGAELMLYQLRLTDGRADPHSSGSLIHPDGQVEHLPFSAFRLTPQEVWQSPKSGGRYPIRWQIQVPGRDLDLSVQAAFPDQELDTRGSTLVTYWEGSVAISGTAGNRPIAGVGYLEMTGYAAPFRQPL